MDNQNSTISTIERYLESHEQELKHNGYFLCKGKLLKEFKLRYDLQYVSDINVAHYGYITPTVLRIVFRWVFKFQYSILIMYKSGGTR